MKKTNTRILITVACLLALIALILGLFVSQRLREVDVEAFHGTLLKQPRIVQPFRLMGVDMVPFTNESLKGPWTMLFFGFTHCGSICPTTMAQLSKMMHLLDASGVKTTPRVVMVSVDPERDSLVNLGKYVKGFNPHFYAATGDERSIRSMTQEMGIAYEQFSNAKSPEDNIEHTGTLLLFNPSGELCAFFTSPHDPAFLAEDFKLLQGKTLR